jgi:hypothetical protein
LLLLLIFTAHGTGSHLNLEWMDEWQYRQIRTVLAKLLLNLWQAALAFQLSKFFQQYAGVALRLRMEQSSFCPGWESQ